jgi:beta-phosphoglucomutase-like phosphatase (HAD superfamily)
MGCVLTLNRTQAIIWDLDGVLVDSEEAWDAARRRLVGEAGGTWREEATRAMMGMSAPEWSAYLRDELAVPLKAEEIDRRVIALPKAALPPEREALDLADAVVGSLDELFV